MPAQIAANVVLTASSPSVTLDTPGSNWVLFGAILTSISGNQGAYSLTLADGTTSYTYTYLAPPGPVTNQPLHIRPDGSTAGNSGTNYTSNTLNFTAGAPITATASGLAAGVSLAVTFTAIVGAAGIAIGSTETTTWPTLPH